MFNKVYIYLLFFILAIFLSGCKDNNKAFRRACAEGHFQEVQEMIESKKIDINQHSLGMGPTALMLAAQGGHLDVVSILIKSGAQINKQDGFGMTALLLASLHGHDKIMQLLLDNKADVNIAIKTGETPLMAAVMHFHRNTVEILLNNGADVNIVRNGDKKNALDIALLESKENLTSEEKKLIFEIIAALKAHGGIPSRSMQK